MKDDEFRRIALSLPGAVEGAHMGHPDFRAGGKIFATLAYPGQDVGMVKLTPEQQRELLQAEPETFARVKGGWGLQGATTVRLANADPDSVGAALTLAFRNVTSAKPKPAPKPKRKSK